jgi:hypothetical protein
MSGDDQSGNNVLVKQVETALGPNFFGRGLDKAADSFRWRLNLHDVENLYIMKYVPNGVSEDRFVEVLDQVIARMQEKSLGGSYDERYGDEETRFFQYKVNKEEIYDFEGKFVPNFIHAAVDYLNSIPKLQQRDWSPLSVDDFLTGDDMTKNFSEFTKFIYNNINLDYASPDSQIVRLFQLVDISYPMITQHIGRGFKVDEHQEGLMLQEEVDLLNDSKATLDFAMKMLHSTYSEAVSQLPYHGNSFMCVMMPGFIYDNLVGINTFAGAKTGEDKCYGSVINMNIDSTHTILGIQDTEHDLG